MTARELFPLNMDPRSEAYEWSSHTKYKELAARVERVLALPESKGEDRVWSAAWNACREHVLRQLDGEEP